MANTAGQWKATWEEMKREFEEQTNLKKPSKKFLGFRKRSGVAAAFGKMDDEYKTIMKAMNKFETVSYKPFHKAVKDAGKEVDSYCRLLDKEVANEVEGTDLKKMLKILKKQAVALIKEAEAVGAELEQSKQPGITFDQKAFDKARTFLVAKLKNGSLFVAKRTRDKDVQAFNAEIEDIAGEIWNGHVHMLNFFSYSTQRKREIAALIRPLEPWAKNGETLPNDASEDDVAEVCRELHTAIKDSAAWVKQVQP